MSSEFRTDVLIVGGGPAGMAAAIAARGAGLQTVLVEERRQLGGQIYKQLPEEFWKATGRHQGRDERVGGALIDAARDSGAEIRLGTGAWGIWGGRVGLHTEGRAAEYVEAERIILATGAFDRPIAFPGWTLPGVITAGAAQALIKIQRIRPGMRILMAGSGPLVLAFSAQLVAAGANVIAVAEASPFPGMIESVRLAWQGRGNPDLIADGIRYLVFLQRHRIPYWYRHAIVRIDGDGRAERATVARIDGANRPVLGTERVLEVDTVCLGYGFTPLVELARLRGCVVHYKADQGGWVPARDDRMQTSQPGVYAAGDGGGIAGARVATLQGRLAGLSAASDLRPNNPVLASQIAAVQDQLRGPARFAAALSRIYPLREGLERLEDPETIVCRCEEVSVGQIHDARRPTAADPGTIKARTRTGMGLCQGRYCADRVRRIAEGGAPSTTSVNLGQRFPVRPIPIGAIAHPGIEAGGH